MQVVYFMLENNGFKSSSLVNLEFNSFECESMSVTFKIFQRIGFLLVSFMIGCSFESDEIYFVEVDLSEVESPEISFFQETDSALYLRGLSSINFGSNNSDIFFGYDVLLGNDTIKSGEKPSSININTLNYKDGIQDLTLITYTKSNSKSLADSFNLEVLTSVFTRKVLIDNKPVEFNITGFSIIDSVLNINWDRYDDLMFQRIEIKQGDWRENETLNTIVDQNQLSQEIPAYKDGALSLIVTLFAKNERHDFPLSYRYFYDLSVEDQETNFKLTLAKSPFSGKRTLEVRHYYSFRPDFRGNDPYDSYSISEGDEIELPLRRVFPTKYKFELYGNFGEEERLLGIKKIEIEDFRVLDPGLRLNSYIDDYNFVVQNGKKISKYNLNSETTTELFDGEGTVISEDARNTLLVNETSINYVSNEDASLLGQYTLESLDVEGPPMAWSISNSGIAYLLTDRGGNGNPFRPERFHFYYLIDMKSGEILTRGGHSSGPFTGGFPTSQLIVRDDLKAITSRFASNGFYFIINSDIINTLRYESTGNNNSFFPSDKDYYLVFEGNTLMKYTYPSIEIHDNGTSTYYDSEVIESIILDNIPGEILLSRNYYGYTDGVRLFNIYDMETHELIESIEVVNEIIDNDLYIGLKLFDDFLIANAGTSTTYKTIVLEY